MRLQQANRAADLFTIAMIASVVVALGAFAWRVITVYSPTPSGNAQDRSTARDNGDIAPILALAPFGKSDGRTAPPTSLALELRGVLLTNPRAASTALIAPTGGMPLSYAIGQAVPGGAVIEDIAIERVLLRINGRLERLDLPHVSTASTAPAPTGFGQPVSSMTVTPMRGALNAASPAPSAGIALLDAVPAMPTSGGYRVGSPLSPNAQKAGLQPGDVIERVNGLTPDALTRDRGSLAAIVASGSAEITVLRGGRRLSLPFSLR